MLKNIALERPLAVIDLETTGTDPKLDRIVEVSVLKLLRKFRPWFGREVGRRTASPRASVGDPVWT